MKKTTIHKIFVAFMALILLASAILPFFAGGF